MCRLGAATNNIVLAKGTCCYSCPHKSEIASTELLFEKTTSSSYDDGLADAICAGSSFLVLLRKKTLDQAVSDQTISAIELRNTLEIVE
jgi:hypothetical protein